MSGLEFGFINEAFKDAIILLAAINLPAGPVSFQSVFQIRSRVRETPATSRKENYPPVGCGNGNEQQQSTTNFEDIIQVVVGACALCVPVAFSEEAWNLGRTLPAANIIVLVVLSLLFVNLYSLHNIFQGRITHRIFAFFARTFIDYCIKRCPGRGRRAVRPGPYAHFQRAMGGRQARRGALFPRLDGSGGRG